jgi:hypothetical protein
MKIKPGYKTSEFWFTFVSFIFSGLYLMGVLTENEQKEELITVVSHAVESCILISGQLIILYKYIKGREKVKEVASQHIIEEPQKNESRTKTTKRRTNKARSSKANSKLKTKTTRS